MASAARVDLAKVALVRVLKVPRARVVPPPVRVLLPQLRPLLLRATTRLEEVPPLAHLLPLPPPVLLLQLLPLALVLPPPPLVVTLRLRRVSCTISAIVTHVSDLLLLALDPAVIAPGFAQNGQAQAEAGQVASLTSTNNFINFCLTTKLPITNGQQITSGSCNPAPMGVIAAQSKMPSSKFTNPVNGQVIKANTAFTISMAIQNLQTGNFVNPNTNYFAAPQQVDGSGNIVGHSHVVVDTLQSVTQTTPTDPTKFAFFKGLNAAAQGGVLTADVTDGLPAGTYRLSSINTAANHQPVLVAVAQHGALDDQVYVSVNAF